MRALMRSAMAAIILGSLLLSAITSQAPAAVQEIAYSFTKGDSGGIAIACVDSVTGQIVESKVLFESADCRMALKVRRTGEGIPVATNIDEDRPSLFVASSKDADQVREIRLSSVPDELRVAGNLGIVTCDQDMIAVVDLAQAQLVREWDTSDTLEPAGNKPESIYITQDQKYALVTFQKDSKKGKKKGSRIAIYRLPQVERVADLRLPRDRPELHLPGNLKEQGPGPELVYVSPATNTLIVTLDLYGAVGLADWSAAQSNRLENWTTLSTAVDGEWGKAFPDRTTPLTLRGHEFYLVCNAGVRGGAVLVSLDRRSIVWRSDAPPGLEQPVYLPQLSKAYSVCSGKTKVRRETEVEKSTQPQKILYEFDYSSRESIRAQSLNQIALDGDFAMKISLARQDPPLLLIATGSVKDEPRTLLTYDPIERRIVDRQPAVGILGRFED